jgi:proteasome maturation protein
MELKIAKEGEWRPAALGGASGVHRDILEGRDCEVGWEDVFVGKFLLWVWVGGLWRVEFWEWGFA